MGTLGIVLSGGGFKGVAHAGVFKYLEEKGITITHISGTSVGAVAGALYAAGNSSEKIADFFKNLPLYKLSNYAFNKPGLFDSEKYSSIFIDHFKEDSFESLNKKLYVSVTDLESAENKVIYSGPLVKVLLASSAFPMLFSPIEINGHLYADGGIMNNFPVEPLMGKCEKIIGVYVNPLNHKNRSELSNSLTIIERAYQMSSSVSSLNKFKMVDKVISPRKLSQYNSFTHTNLDEIFEIGYQSAKELLSDFQVVF